jgi:hypothetical protein
LFKPAALVTPSRAMWFAVLPLRTRAMRLDRLHPHGSSGQNRTRVLRLSLPNDGSDPMCLSYPLRVCFIRAIRLVDRLLGEPLAR